MAVATDRTTEFIVLFSKHSQRIYRFIRSLVDNRTDAEEIYQNTCTVLWSKFDLFETGSNFWAWSCQIVRYEVLNYRRRQNLERNIFSNEFYNRVAEQAMVTVDELDQQQAALSVCYELLSERQKEVLEKIYEPDANTKSVADALKRSPNAIYKTLRRAHELLFSCIQRRLHAGDLF
ncbi:sigma-70 family RNA polymerase sigma factor [uncultured Gimesia sp.]|uniref:sigma-70 family RNA polymerase sigma factor n=1 Tax=uncultured Gimesia sp. TaxID=1678688 RepID=UPI0030D98FD8|tara:strand:+ start:56820 stop:57350 length:531 start_codon:yes stop_codon:yes gene_type:complete